MADQEYRWRAVLQDNDPRPVLDDDHSSGFDDHNDEEETPAAEFVGCVSSQFTFPEISNLAYKEHNALQEKHETVLEREYIRAFQTAFNYQRDIVKNLRGAADDPFVARCIY